MQMSLTSVAFEDEGTKQQLESTAFDVCPLCTLHLLFCSACKSNSTVPHKKRPPVIQVAQALAGNLGLINSGQESQMEVSVAELLNLNGYNWINDQACW